MDLRIAFTALNNAAYAAAKAARDTGHTDATILRDFALYTDLLVDGLPAREVAA